MGEGVGVGVSGDVWSFSQGGRWVGMERGGRDGKSQKSSTAAVGGTGPADADWDGSSTAGSRRTV